MTFLFEKKQNYDILLLSTLSNGRQLLHLSKEAEQKKTLKRNFHD